LFVFQILAQNRVNLALVFDVVTNTSIALGNNAFQGLLNHRPELAPVLMKISCWNLTQFKKGVFLDAFTMASSSLLWFLLSLKKFLADVYFFVR
jgi:hypothetical protein